MFQVQTEYFSGPLEKLLELIQEKKLEITVVNLAEVTSDFLDHLKKTEQEMEPTLLADFIVVASRLILIKSKALLPSLELTRDEETEIKDLEARLIIYNEFKKASEHVKKLLAKERYAFSRPLLRSLGDKTFFYPPEGLTVSDLSDAALQLAASLKELIPEPQKIKTAIVTLEQRANELLGRFQQTMEHSFKEISKGRPKIDVVVSFLAILHLLKDRVIHAQQSGQFEDIVIKKQNVE